MDAVFNTGHVSQHRIVNTYFKKLKWLLKWEPSTCTVNIHFSWFPLSSTAWQITSVSPIPNQLPESKITYYGSALSWIISSLWFTPVYRSSWLTKVSCRSFVLWTFCKYGRFCICRSKRKFCWLMHASKAILNLPTSSLHLCSPFQQNRKVKIHHQFTSFPKQLGQDSPPRK